MKNKNYDDKIDPNKVIKIDPVMISDAGTFNWDLFKKAIKAIAVTVVVLLTWIVCLAAIHYMYHHIL